MKIATKRMEIQLLKKHFKQQPTTNVDSINNLIKDLDASESNIAYLRITSFIEANFQVHKKLPSYWDFYFFMEDLQLGWKRYFLGCSHPQSIFISTFEKEYAATGCHCCTYWRGRLNQLILDAILFGTILFTILHK